MTSKKEQLYWRNDKQIKAEKGHHRGVKMSELNLLKKNVLNASQSNVWGNAVAEWDIVAIAEDARANSVCVCAQEGLRYLYKIQNRINGNVLFPIGSSCIKQFARADLNEEVKNMQSLFYLINAVKQGEKIELSAQYFSRKFLAYLYAHGAFKGTQYNYYEGWRDYEFMRDMFNKRTPSIVTVK